MLKSRDWQSHCFCRCLIKICNVLRAWVQLSSPWDGLEKWCVRLSMTTPVGHWGPSVKYVQQHSPWLTIQPSGKYQYGWCYFNRKLHGLRTMYILCWICHWCFVVEIHERLMNWNTKTLQRTETPALKCKTLCYPLVLMHSDTICVLH